MHFADYRIRAGPEASGGAGPGRLLCAACGPAPAGPGRASESLTRPGKFVTLAAAALAAGAAAARLFKIARDYGMTDRAEAPD